EEVRSGIKDLFESELAIHAGVLLVDKPDVRTSAQFVELAADTSPAELVGALMADDSHDDDLDLLVAHAIQGDTAALAALSDKLPDWNKKGRLQLLRSPEEARDRILAVLRAWQTVFATIEPRVTAIIERDYEQRAADRTRLAPSELIETTTGGVRYLPEPGIARVILGPSHV